MEISIEKARGNLKCKVDSTAKYKKHNLPLLCTAYLHNRVIPTLCLIS
jgi:hypothetical protein